MTAFIKHKAAEPHQAKQLIILANKNECLSARSPLMCRLQFSRVRLFTHSLKFNYHAEAGQGERSWSSLVHVALMCGPYRSKKCVFNAILCNHTENFVFLFHLCYFWPRFPSCLGI